MSGKEIDKEMKPLITELNNVGLITTSSCSGHRRHIDGNINNYAHVVIKMDNISSVDITKKLLVIRWIPNFKEE